MFVQNVKTRIGTNRGKNKMAKLITQPPPNWRIIRKQVLERDNYTCQSCGTKPKAPHVHHIIPRDKGGSEDLKNLITKCLGCHISEEYAEKPQKTIIKFGKKNGIQRFQCKNCGHVFTTTNEGVKAKK